MSCRSVVTSNGTPSATTVTVPCSMPVATGRNPAAVVRRITSSGNAVVAMSMSPGGTPSSTLRTAPPTIRASSPSRSSTASTAPAGPRVSASAVTGRLSVTVAHPAPGGRFRCARARKRSAAARPKTRR